MLGKFPGLFGVYIMNMSFFASYLTIVPYDNFEDPGQIKGTEETNYNSSNRLEKMLPWQSSFLPINKSSHFQALWGHCQQKPL